MTRTSTELPRLEPESSASTNSAMAAKGEKQVYSYPPILRKVKAFLLLFYVPFTLTATPFTDQLLDSEGAPSPLLIQLLEWDNLYAPDDTLDQIIEKTQQHWMKIIRGKGGIERRDLIDSPEQLARKEALFSLLEAHGFFDALTPKKKSL